MQYLSLASDILLLAATAGMALWCRKLSARPVAPAPSIGTADPALAALATRIDALERVSGQARAAEDDHTDRLAAGTAAADDRIGRLEMLLASLEDVEEDVADRMFADAPPGPSLPSFRAARQPLNGGTR